MENIPLKSDLSCTASVDFNDPTIKAFLGEVPTGYSSSELAIWVYYKVRDSFLYDPYHLDIRPESLKASMVLTKKRAWCVEKALVTVACLRYLEIPARFGFGIVKNHIGVEKLLNYLQREEIVFHGYVSVFLNGKWVKCTPAFDQRICKLSKVPPLDWDGSTDSLFQAYVNDQQFMEYVHFYGEFSEIPFELMHHEMKKYYPHLIQNPIITKEFSFQFDNDIYQ